MEERHLNIKKVVVTALIFIFAFIIIILSAVLTHNSKKNKKEKNLSIRDVNDIRNNASSVKVSDEDNKNTTDEVKNNTNTQNSNNNTTQKPKEQNKNTGKGKLPVYNENANQLAKEIYSSDEKNIYLTFDDGPSPNITPQILDILDKYNVPATFFVLGSRAELYPDLVKREFNSGHYIANHGYTHSYSKIYSSVQSVLDEYNQTELAIQNALGIPEFHSYLFRFPGGSSGGPYNDLKQEAKSYLTQNGIASTNWNCLTGDSEAVGRTKQELLSELYDTASGYDSLVVLMHDADDKKNTAEILPEIIEHYMAEGYTFKNYYEIFQ